VSDARATVARYMEAYDRGDYDAVLDTLTDDVEWVLPGAFHLTGREAFRREMANPAFVHPPNITVTRLITEGDVVVAEGRVRTTRIEGGELHLVFCDVFELEDGRIRRLTSYLMETKP
jgi:uncharacterized protein